MEVSFEDDVAFEGRNRTTGSESEVHVHLIFGSLTQSYALLLKFMVWRFIREVRNDFIKAWDKVMNLDRFDL
jgi:catalase-peroxidase